MKTLVKIQYSYFFPQVPWVYGTLSASSSYQELSLPAEEVAQTPRPEPRHLPRKKRQVHFFDAEPS